MTCTCPHTPDYHRRPVYSQSWQCIACATCGLGMPLHNGYWRDYTPKTRDGHKFAQCTCTGANT